MMGSGKSSIGLLVSKKLNINFIDIDNEIEKKIKMKIKNIFEIKGENYFRKVEEDMTLKVLNNIRNVISLGGGGFLNKQIRKEVLDNHISFWLNWKSKTLLKRIKDSKKRPIAIKSSKNELSKLIKERSIVYSKALYKIDCEGLSKLEIANYILKIYENN